jgi:hypothetical protein
MTDSRDRISERKIKEKIERIYTKNECEKRKKKRRKNDTIVGDLIERLPEMVDIIHKKREKNKYNKE